jgi:hypothetical protein
VGKAIRQFLRDLFGSRMADHLWVEILQLRQDFEVRLKEKDEVIANLREEKAQLVAKVTIYELTLMPHSSRMGAEVVNHTKLTKPNFATFSEPPMKSKWEMVVEEHEKQIAKELAEEAEEAKKKEAPLAARNWAGEQGAG